MFDKILIANRGEIACRVIRTARRMGLGTVAVHSDVDAGAQHVLQADQAVSLGGATPAESYLRGDAIIQAARDAGAGAIHPGYGFLSENPDFVEAVEEAGLTFIGPSARAIRAMGLKDAAKALMEKAGVPVVPGYHGADQDDARLSRAAEEIGYPVLIKAVAGGGGKGMRLVEHAGDFAAALASARNEAKGAFGNADVLVEKFVTAPRHIEIQVFGDGKDAVQLFERDCSLQRRHQKVIEEAPAPGMTPQMREAMGQAAVRAAEAIGYSGAGTVEFIVDGSDGLRPDRFWFMEMNTRLQVEHPVTEAVTGVDLVEWQIRVARGEALPATQQDLGLKGHAVEARLYAEDVPAGFLPAVGRLDLLEFPGDVRADSGVVTGDRISPYYDPMIAKLIVHAPTRSQALQRMGRALDVTRIAGLTTNLDFLAALVRQPDFAAGDVDTGLIERNLAKLKGPEAPGPEELALAALAALGLDGAAEDAGFALWQPLEWTVRMVVGGGGPAGGREVEARVALPGPQGAGGQAGTGTRARVRLAWVDPAEAGEAKDLLLETRGGQWWLDGRRLDRQVMRHGQRLTVTGRGSWILDVVDPLDRAGAGAAAGNMIEAPMPGLIRAIRVATGDRVAEGAPLAVLEAMKMEHTLTAPRDCRIAEILAAEGDQVEAGASLIVLADDDEADDAA
ncbi:3-methylcrotonyl-CoA carboxylase [Brevirhabdus pacifica]|uniref:3-methylcrotonyl-CoA carboxylase n=3 Tax=Brevirhabdus pacifica TaxID=1267768 RepID=A0A1U7DKV3_9RHOB|nr:acetyl/propionyl/methylcrotonyl-CoA carboxylase subunit alpha [Brevirhabdus pacifica]APX90602.1 3-methylcrotonyl-CoA carboxylase [Brevirhabdus pacifica]OWU78402.1 3-methylcrotonyl-CoA carboxylase [Loktanella sp. 22II-4b]PJJ85260.1 3-methylcrotonyl-CoA carboxylase alpha subunit [Brevirhabdus pacifica]